LFSGLEAAKQQRRFRGFKFGFSDYAVGMSYLTLEVEIDHGRIVPREPERLPEKGNGLLTILHSAMPPSGGKPARQRVELPLIRGDGKRLIDPSPEELDASAWAD
jgi:hypothetical protein